ncbi:MAG: hypothetical protein KJP18_17800 [Gemmatimonadetes bacterium]|nr:hypothetical protein [Gemmatimonadota bacterium]
MGILVAVVAGCTDDGPAPPVAAFAATDSAGTRIIASGGPMWADDEGWSIAPEPDAEFGDATDPAGALHRVAALAPLPDGGVAVANGGSNEVIVFDPEGAVRDRLGREGDGPGEFRWLNGVLARGDSIVGVDGSRLRFSVFDPSGALAREFSLDPVPGQPTGIRAVAAGSSEIGVYREVAFTDKSATGIIRLPGDVAIVDWAGGRSVPLEGDFPGGAIFAIPDGMGTLPFGADLHLTGADGRVLVGAGERPEIREYGADGDLVRLIRWGAPTRPVGESLQREWKEAQLASMEEELSSLPAEARQGALQKQRDFQERMLFPSSLPAHGRLLADPGGNLWVQRYRTGLSDDTPTSWQGKRVGPEAPPDATPDRWWVFDPDGRWLGEVVTPPGLRLEVIVDDALWGVHRDAFGVETIRRHRLVR